MRFLITGASGFIGFKLTQKLAEIHGRENIHLLVNPCPPHEKEARRLAQLKELGFQITPFDLLTSDDSIVKATQAFDVIFHLAAFAETEKNDPRRNAVNDEGLGKLIDRLGTALRGKCIIFTSSLAAVDRSFADNTPQSESYPCRPRTLYGQTKLRGEKILTKKAQAHGFHYVVLRLPTVYGPGYRPGGLFDLISDSLRRKTLMARLSWPGKIGLVYADDVVAALIQIAQKPNLYDQTYHLESETAPTLDELCDGIAAAIDVKRKRLAIPKFIWSFLSWVCWIPGLLSILPYGLMNTFWRLSLILCDGMVSDGKKLNREISVRYTPLATGLQATFSNPQAF